jgi:DNA-binding transcriptional MerR regulator
MKVFTIKDLENLSGIKSHTIRIWEKRYSFLNPQRSDSNIRYYTIDELQKLLNIALLNKYGYKISTITKMNLPERVQRIAEMSLFDARKDKAVNELVLFMLNADIENFETVLDSFIISLGIDRTITELIIPFLQRAKGLRRSSYINSIQEHFVNNVIRQKIILGIERTVPHTKKGLTALLFLPEGQHQELTLLCMYFFLKRGGVQVLYLGANLSTKNLELMSKQKAPDFLCTYISKKNYGFNVSRFLQYLNQYEIPSTLIVSGDLKQLHLTVTSSRIKFINHAHEVLDHIDVHQYSKSSVDIAYKG